MNRIEPELSKLQRISDPNFLMREIVDLLDTSFPPESGKYYTFRYRAKTPNIAYDRHPLVEVVDVFNWGFRGVNYHWGEPRQYTWDEILGQIYEVTEEEFITLQSLPFQALNN